MIVKIMFENRTLFRTTGALLLIHIVECGIYLQSYNYLKSACLHAYSLNRITIIYSQNFIKYDNILNYVV